VPGFTTQTSKLDATIKAVAAHDAAFLGANVMYLKGGTRDHFMGFLARAYPHLVENYERLYAGAYASPEYVKTVRGLIDAMKDRYDMKKRLRDVDVPEPEENTVAQEPQQHAFRW
jgi:hypothetical protein